MTEYKSKQNIIIFIIALIIAIILTSLLLWNVFENNETGKTPTRIPTVSDKKEVAEFINEKPDRLRLFPNAFPISYHLTIQVFIPGFGYLVDDKNMHFHGKVLIKINLKTSQNVIELNSQELLFNNSECFIEVNGEKIEIQIIEKPNDYKIIIQMLSGNDFQPNIDYILTLKFNGKINTDFNGLYETNYLNKNGEKRTAVVTQFEPVHARKMVPCFDEPRFKATWKVNVIHPRGSTAISNGIEEGTTGVDDQFVETTFKETPRMSSYLLALFVSDFEFTENYTTSGIRFRVWSRPEEINSTKYALESGIKCLEYFEQLFQIPFPLQKVDMVAVPDFKAGAMENWGLITYRQDILLYNPKIVFSSQKRKIATVIAHELAHQWFGNLVTLKWWNNLWLNEGFATFFELIGADKISDGHFKMTDWFFEGQKRAFKVDSKSNASPLMRKISKIENILDAFDGISYKKGSSILWMLRDTIGEHNFNKGINQYLKEFQYSNVVNKDLIFQLNQTIPNNFRGPNGNQFDLFEFMNQWTENNGYPRLFVDQIDTNQYIVNNKLKKKLIWDVPIEYQSINGDKHKTWLQKSTPLILNSTNLIILNIDSNGFYTVTYSDKLWEKIQNQLASNHHIFSIKTRARLIEDSFIVEKGKKLPFSPIPLKLISYLINERDFLPWFVAISEISKIRLKFGMDSKKSIIDEFVKKLIMKSSVKPSIEYIQKNYLNEEAFLKVSLNELLIESLCEAKQKDYINSLNDLFKKEVAAKCKLNEMTSKCSNVAAPLRKLVYCFGVEKGGKKEFDQVLKWFKNEINHMEKMNLQNALACSQDSKALNNFMLLAIDPQKSLFPVEDALSLFHEISKKSLKESLFPDFLIKNYDTILERFRSPEDLRMIIRFLTSRIENTADFKKLEKLHKKKNKKFDFSPIIMQKMLAMEWKKKNRKTIAEIFKNQLKELEKLKRKNLLLK